MSLRRVTAKAIACALVVGAMTVGTSSAFAADKHPPKFGPHDNQCQAEPDQPQCAGNH